jgi:hypothetical protein
MYEECFICITLSRRQERLDLLFIFAVGNSALKTNNNFIHDKGISTNRNVA